MLSRGVFHTIQYPVRRQPERMQAILLRHRKALLSRKEADTGRKVRHLQTFVPYPGPADTFEKVAHLFVPDRQPAVFHPADRDRKSTRLNSSHANISYAVFCLKKQTSKAARPTSTVLQHT